jgi:SAM-dependent methyltransferase
MRIEHTTAYFDEHTPEYSVDRLEFAVGAIKRLAAGGGSLVDIGCGTGNILELVARETTVSRIVGIDVSARYLDITRKRLGCEVLHGSITDDGFAGRNSGQFDFALLAAVLHHLVGSTRTQSRRLAERAIVNALSMLKPGGHLVIIEPVFYPPVAMDLVFHMKRFVTRYTEQRVEIFGTWNNIGAPIVSYYASGELLKMIKRSGGNKIVENDTKDMKSETMLRFIPFVCRAEMTVLTRKTAAE